MDKNSQQPSMSGLDQQYLKLLNEQKQNSINANEAGLKHYVNQESLREFNCPPSENGGTSYQSVNRMFASTTLYDRNSVCNIPQRQSKLQKSVILFDSGVTLGDLEKLKITNMKDIKMESKIIDQEIGNVDDKQFVAMMANENLQKRMSSRLTESQRLPRQSTKSKTDFYPENMQVSNQAPPIEVDQICLQEQNPKATMLLSTRLVVNPVISTIQEQNEDLSELQEKQNKSESDTEQRNGSKQNCSSAESDTDMEIDDDDEVVEDEHCNISDKIQSIPVMNIVDKNTVTYKPNVSTSIPFQIGPLLEMKGYLKKRSPSYIVGWQKRWCILKDQKLFYYKNEKSFRQYGVICFNIISCRAELIVGKKSKTKKLYLTFPNNSKTFTFKSDDHHQPIEAWYKQIVNHIVQSHGYKNNLTLEAKRFWRDERISVREFYSMADTGDLILFRGKSIEARLQRAFTGSDFDHVALVLKYSTSDLFVMEALGGKIGKVILFRWNLFSKNKWYEFYDKIVYRKLSMNRSNHSLTHLEKFIQYALGKKYKFTLGKIMRKKTSAKEESDSNEDRTFFCSELVAACYKKLGILNEHLASSSYLPGHFSLEKDLKLQNGAHLGSEQVVDFTMD